MGQPVIGEKFGVGQSVRRLEDPLLLQGLGRYNVAFMWEAGNREAVARAFEAEAHVTRLNFVVTRAAAASLEPRADVPQSQVLGSLP